MLHGTQARRTNLCEGNCGLFVPYLGVSVDSWSPNGDYLRQFTFDTVPDSNFRDYDPTWSPLGDQICFDRNDWKILGKGIPGVAGVTDTVLFLITASGNPLNRGDLTPSYSPNGQWVAFSRKDQQTGGTFGLWKTKATGGGAVQLTNPVGAGDQYPRWSPDGEWIVFDRRFYAVPPTAETHGVYKVPANGGTAVQVYGPVEAPPDTLIAATPAWSADGLIITAGRGIRRGLSASVTTHTFDPALSEPQMKPIQNYGEPQFTNVALDPLLSPVQSPDGTRLHLSAKQIWAARRNMNVPPRITQVGSQGIHDTTARVFINAIQGAPTSITITSTDLENDPITCTAPAAFLEDGMTFDPSTCTLNWTPAAPIGSKYYVKFQVTTPSGGTDAVIAVLTVVPSLMPSPEEVAATGGPDGPNPTRGRFALTAPLVRGTTAQLTVFDLIGRKIAVVRGPSGTQLVWQGRDHSGTLAAPGVYLYRLAVGTYRQDGKLVVLR